MANEAAATATPATRTYRILVVDDHSIVRRGLRALLESQSGRMARAPQHDSPFLLPSPVTVFNLSLRPHDQRQVIRSSGLVPQIAHHTSFWSMILPSSSLRIPTAQLLFHEGFDTEAWEQAKVFNCCRKVHERARIPHDWVTPTQFSVGEPSRSLPDSFNTRSNQRETQWPACHELDSFGTHTSYVITPSSAKTLLIKPSSLVWRLYSNCPTWNLATL
jgi:hypothetical protein